jgi:hypothetical protein
MDMQEIENRLLDIIRTYAGQLPMDQLNDMAELVQAGESGIALENLCTQLFEYDITVGNEMLNDLRALGSSMGLQSKYWDRLKNAK